MPPKAARQADDPNQLTRVEAGVYRTADERFEVRGTGVGWMLLDLEVTDDFGQPLTRGPFPTLDAVREAVPEARRATIRAVTPRKGKRSG